MGDLKNFFSPKIIAVIGASNEEGKVGNVLMEKLKTFKGRIVPINPKHDYVLGKKTYASVLKCPWKIDLAIIAIPAQIAVSALEECGKKGIKNAIVITAGFSEAGNKELEDKLVETAEKHNIKILGPNCFGIVNPYNNFDCTFSNSTPKKGSTAFISQSGALWSYVSDFETTSISGFVSLGNQAMLTFSDFIEYFNNDEKTKRIVLYIERLKNGKKFVEICRKSKKPIIVIKAGKTKKGTEATVSHTGSLATDFEIYKGAFKQAKVKVLDSLAEAFGLKKENIKIKEKEVKIIGNAGGAIALLTDTLTEKGIKVQSKDLLGTALAKDYENEIKKSEGNAKILVVLTPQKMSQPEEVAKILNKNHIAVFLGDKSMKKAEKIFKDREIKYYTKCC